MLAAILDQAGHDHLLEFGWSIRSYRPQRRCGRVELVLDHGADRGTSPAIPVEDREEIEILVAGTDLEADPRSTVTIQEQPAVAQHAVHKIGRRVVENDNLCSLTQGPFEIAFEVESKIVELTRRCRPKKEANIDVAAG